ILVHRERGNIRQVMVQRHRRRPWSIDPPQPAERAVVHRDQQRPIHTHHALSYRGRNDAWSVPPPGSAMSSGTVPPAGIGVKLNVDSCPVTTSPFRVARRFPVSITSTSPSMSAPYPIERPSTVTCTESTGPVTVHVGHADSSPGFCKVAVSIVVAEPG